MKEKLQRATEEESPSARTGNRPASVAACTQQIEVEVIEMQRMEQILQPVFHPTTQTEAGWTEISSTCGAELTACDRTQNNPTKWPFIHSQWKLIY